MINNPLLNPNDIIISFKKLKVKLIVILRSVYIFFNI